jgi:hypothetical protein
MSEENKTMKFSEMSKFSPKQMLALEAVKKYKYTLYGGAKFGGKSHFLRWISVYLLTKWAQEGHTGVRIMLACEDYPALRDRQITRIRSEFPPWLGKLADSQIEGMSFTLSEEYGGGIIALRNLDDPSKYASAEFAAVLVDELTKNKKELFDQFRSIIRWPGIVDTKFIGATNPGGIGGDWVKRLWIDRIFDENEKEADQYHFVQALAYDNPTVTEKYIDSLKSLPPILRAAYLEGRWDVFEGQFLQEWNPRVHVVTPFDPPDTWRRIRAIDHGRTAPTACLWGAVDYDGNIWWYREYYAAGRDADVNAREIARMSAGENYWFSVMDSACWSKHGGETIAEIYERNGVISEPWPKDRHARAAITHEFLRSQTPLSVFRSEVKMKESDPLPESVSYDEMTGMVSHAPKMRFMTTCPNSIRTLPMLVMDKNDPEDCDTDGDDHLYDCLGGALEYLHEGKTRKPLTTIQKLMRKSHSSFVPPARLGDFYANRV